MFAQGVYATALCQGVPRPVLCHLARDLKERHVRPANVLARGYRHHGHLPDRRRDLGAAQDESRLHREHRGDLPRRQRHHRVRRHRRRSCRTWGSRRPQPRWASRRLLTLPRSGCRRRPCPGRRWPTTPRPARWCSPSTTGPTSTRRPGHRGAERAARQGRVLRDRRQGRRAPGDRSAPRWPTARWSATTPGDHPSLTGKSTGTRPLTQAQVRERAVPGERRDRDGRRAGAVAVAPAVRRRERAPTTRPPGSSGCASCWTAGTTSSTPTTGTGCPRSRSPPGLTPVLRDGTIVAFHDGLRTAAPATIRALPLIVAYMNAHHLGATTAVRPDATGGCCTSPGQDRQRQATETTATAVPAAAAPASAAPALAARDGSCRRELPVPTRTKPAPVSTSTKPAPVPTTTPPAPAPSPATPGTRA